MREFAGFPDVHTVASLGDHEFLRSYFRVFAPGDEFLLPTFSVVGRKVVPFGESEALVALLYAGGNGGPNVFVVFREAVHKGVVAEEIGTIGAEFDRDVRDLNADGFPEIMVQHELEDNLYLARASRLLWPEVYRFTGKSYEKRSMEFPSFYVLDYWPRIMSHVHAETSLPEGYAASETEILTRAKGTLLAQQEVLRRVNEVVEAARVHIFKETGQDPLFVPDAQMSRRSLAYPGDPGDTNRNGAPPESRESDSAQQATPKSPPEALSGSRLVASEQASEARRRTDANTGPAWLHIVLGFVGAAAVGAVGMWLLVRRRSGA